MIFNFKKVASVLASAVMLSSTIGFAAAASYPEPFVVGGAADGAVVWGANAAMSDLTAAIDVQSNLQALVTSGSGGTSTTVGGTAWQVGTTSDPLELGESLVDIGTYIDSSDLGILVDGTMDNEKGTAKYEQFLYFEGTASSYVTYDQNPDNDEVGLFYKISSGEVIARYVIEFTSPLKSDVDGTGGSTYSDIEDETINVLGKEYVITKAVNSSATNSDLTLMSGASKGTVANGEEVVIGGRTVSVIVSASNAAQFTIDGETTNKLNEGDTEPLSDGTYLGVTDITYQSFSGGLMQATIYLGADKLFLDDGSNLQVNAETINYAAVTVTESFASNDVSITQISINMTAEDDLYVPVNGKLSGATALDEPEVLITENWDIEFKGLETRNEETVKLAPTGSDKRYELTFNNYDGKQIVLPVVFTNDSGIFGGEKPAARLLLNSTAMARPITKDDYFILNTANPLSASSNARSYVVQYKGADKATDTDPKATFDILGVENGREMTLASSGSFSLKGLGGATFNFINASSCDSATNCNIILNQADFAGGKAFNDTLSAYIRTQYNGLINITDLNHTGSLDIVSTGDAGVATSYAANWIIELYMDDTNRDGDDYVLTTPEQTWQVTLGNATAADATATISINGSEITDPDNSDLSKIMTRYGAYVESEDPTGSPLTVITTIPDGIVEPLVYITSGDITVTPGSTGSGGQILIVKDSEVSSVATKNLVVIGGSCINTVAAKILGFTKPTCGADFTAATEVGAGQYLIEVVKTSEAVAGGSEDKIAMLLAGYEAAQTQSAVTKAMEGVSSDVGSQVYPITATTTA